MKTLHPRAVWIFFLRNIFTGLILFSYLLFIIFAQIVGKTSSSNFSKLNLVIITLVIIMIISYLLARLSYYFYCYELEKRFFKTESGIIWKKYVTIPYDKIQNIDIVRGLWSRILGLSEIQIQTAAVGYEAETTLPGVSLSEAETIKQELMKRIKKPKNRGV